MRKYALGLVFLISSVLIFSCTKKLMSPKPGIQYPPDTRSQVTIVQGVWGNVWFWKGNFMPGSATGTITPVVRQVFVYKPVHIDSVVTVGYSPFYLAIHGTLVATTTSNNTGFFQMVLDTGKYSLFVKEDTLYYANLFDGEGYILPAKVARDSVTKVQIDITYEAYW
ncbi:MAG: hypothetical protein AB1393_12310 [Candidatus Edwardsbacteria bacterium]